MAVHFHSLTVKQVYKETPDCVVISFDIPESLKDLFQFTQGQNITLKKRIGEEELRRTYSICSAPRENNLRVAVKKVDNGKFSSYANTVLKEGDLLEVLPPTGSFYTPLHFTHKKNYLAFAAGSGITPVISIIKTTLAEEPDSSFTLVYGNQRRDSIIFFEELSGLKNQYMNRFNLIHVLSRELTESPLNSGRINAGKLQEIAKLVDYRLMQEIFICGPHEMTTQLTAILKERGINTTKIHVELFSAPGNARPSTQILSPDKNEVAKSAITIQLDGRRINFDLAYNSESILDAALNKGADLPYACKGGVCCTCRARLTEGKVSMDANYALEADELAKGFILTCQSHPLTEKVVIDFDSR